MDKIKNTPYYQDLQKVNIPSLECLRGFRVLVTGATGLIGSAVVDLLSIYADNFDFVIYAGCRDRLKFDLRFKNRTDRLKFFQLDVTVPLSGDIQFDYIIHTASGANPLVFATDPVGVMKSNIYGVCNLMDYGLSHGLKRFLYVSSGESYGEGCDSSWNEDDSGFVNPMMSRSCYPSSKRASETLCASYSSQFGVTAVVARLCHIYGPFFTESDNRVYAQFIRNVMAHEDIVLKSTGEQFRSWLYVVDCAAALLYLLINGVSQNAYNIASEESNITIKELAEHIASIAGRRVVFDIPDNIEKKGYTLIKKAIFNTSKIEKLGWTPITEIKEGLTHTIESRQLYFNI